MTTLTIPAKKWLTSNASTNRHWRHRDGLARTCKWAGQGAISARMWNAPAGAWNSLRGLTRSSGTSREGLA